MLSNKGYVAFVKGKQDADLILKAHGFGPIRQLSKVRPINDYERGKVSRAWEILVGFP